MGKSIERLTALQVKAAKPKPCGQAKIYPDGAGLFLRVGRSKSGETTRSWFFKYTSPQRKPNGRHYEPSLGLGNADTVSLAEARQAARDGLKGSAPARRSYCSRAGLNVVLTLMARGE